VAKFDIFLTKNSIYESYLIVIYLKERDVMPDLMSTSFSEYIKKNFESDITQVRTNNTVKIFS